MCSEKSSQPHCLTGSYSLFCNTFTVRLRLSVSHCRRSTQHCTVFTLKDYVKEFLVHRLILTYKDPCATFKKVSWAKLLIMMTSAYDIEQKVRSVCACVCVCNRVCSEVIRPLIMSLYVLSSVNVLPLSQPYSIINTFFI